MLIFLLSCSLISTAICTERSLVIETESGLVKGKLNEFNGIEFYSYTGIPYAESTSGKMRFKPPVPKKPWTDVLDATKESAVCSQIPKFYLIEETTEDCLHINVYVPKNWTDNLLPVMVFIHGGGLQALSGRNEFSYGPQFLLERQIIYVSMNYRLGPFGFLSLDVEEASGNAGLKDVLLSLKWVKRNIKNFGGDPDKITIAGHSSGSLIVNLLMLTNQSDGLFNQAVQISGSSFAPRSFAKHSRDASFALAKELGIKTDNVNETLQKLQKIDAFKILRTYYKMIKNYDNPLRIYAPFVPTKEVKSDHALFVVDPMEALRKNDLKIHNVPTLVSTTSKEAINMIPYVRNRSNGVKKLKKNPEDLIPSNIEYPIGSTRSKNLAKSISTKYFGEKMQNLNLTTLIGFMSDIQNVYGVYFWIEKYKNIASSQALYLCIFDFKGKLNRNQYLFNTTVSGIGHGDDIPYMFVVNTTKSLYNTLDENTKQMKDTMTNFISNFVYYGNPTPENQNNELFWPDYVKDQNYLLIKENPVVQPFNSSPIYSRMKFWEEIYNEYFNYVDNGGEIQKKIIP